jgi:beta-xylosidase
MKKLLLSLLAMCAGTSAFAADGGFLFVTFKGEATPMTEQIYFGLSKDGRNWKALNGGNPVLVSDLGEKGVRDPYILRSHDGSKFYLLATDLSINLNHDWGRATHAGSKSIVIWESTDLLHWSAPRLVQVAADDAGCTWAPEAMYDEDTQDYLVFWASQNGSDNFAKQRIWACRTKDFKTFSKPFIYIDKANHVIDTDIVRENGKYYRFSKDEQFKAITMEVSDKLMGPWKDVPNFSLSKLVGYEGPACFLLEPASMGKPATWCLLLDYYSRGQGYQPYITHDLKSGKFTPAGNIKFPFLFRHGAVLPLTAEEYARLANPSAKFEVEAPDMAGVPKPILDGFTADPAIRVFGDTYYVYPTSDKPNWMTTDFSVWSSKNLIDWKKEGMVLDVTKDLSWAHIKAWAPDCIARNGKGYFYFCAEGKIGVATGMSPKGPFRDALGKPLLDRKTNPKITSNTIDPYPFIDDDGQAYLFWGNSSGIANVVKLKPDMITLDGDPKEIVIKGTSDGRTVEFREGIVVFKRNGLYYFMWSVDDARSDDYRVAYGTAKSPFGPVEIPASGSLVLQKSGLVKGTGHHSVVNVPGTDRWYMVYHRHAIPGGSGYQRETCLARMEFNPDGSIKPVDPLAPVFPPGSPGEPVARK